MGIISDMINGPAIKKENKKLKTQIAKAEKEKKREKLYEPSEISENVMSVLEKLDRINEEKAKNGEVIRMVKTTPDLEPKKHFYDNEKYKQATKCSPIIIAIAIILIILVFVGII